MAALVLLLREQTDLRGVGTTAVNALAQAIATSHAQNHHEPLTDRFFVQLERDVLAAQQSHRLTEAEAEAILDIAEFSPLEANIAVGAAIPKEAA